MSQCLEIVRFRVPSTHAAPFVAGRPAALEAVRAAYSGMRCAYLTQVSEDEWIDVVLWDSREQASAAAAGVMALPAFATWAALIGEVTSMEHAAVRASHG